MKAPVRLSVPQTTIHLSQGTVVVGAIFAAWILWLAVNNKLIVYWQILTGHGAATAGGGSAPSTGTGTNPAPSGGAQPGSTAPGYIIPPLPSIGFPGVTTGLGL